MRWIWIGGVGLALAVVIGWLFVPRPTPVDLAVVASGPIAESVADQGSARIREAYVVAAPVGGRLHRIDLDVGDRVTAGRTAIARIDPAAADLLDARSRTQAEAGVAAAAATVRASAAEQDRAAAEAQRSEANLTRVRSLAERGVMARQALEDAEAAARTGRAAVRAAAAGLAASRADLVRARAALSNPEANGGRPVLVTAPVTGYVTRVFQESARTVMVGAPLVEVGDSHGLEAAIEFLSQDAVR
ncbi:MAG: efflux transporter periplasmic adaptor subunit, partial [Reyranella sp.]|nr:efflux transporter periplasmic adaptor subunit [Reyranella sp.]